MKENKIRLLIEVDRAFHHAVKMQALNEHMSMKDWIVKTAIEAMNFAKEASND